MQLEYNIIEDFNDLTGKDITVFLEQALSFFSKEQYEIVAFFSGETKEIPTATLKRFDSLLLENDQTFETFQMNSVTMRNAKWWYLIEVLEEIDSRLKTLKKIYKWTRSSLSKITYTSETEQAYTLHQNETLERAAAEVLGFTDIDQWYNVALRNSLYETDYSLEEGGTAIKLYYNLPNRNFKMLSIVDVIVGKSVYGKDLDRKLAFVTDGVTLYTDLKILD